MAAKTKTVAEKPKASALTDTMAQRIARVWIEGDAELQVAGGNLVALIARTAQDVMPKEAQPVDADAVRIVNIVGDKRKWSRASRIVRVSQCKAFLHARAKLPAAIARVTSEFDACHWNDAYKAATAIVKGEDPVSAVRKMRKSKKASAAQPKDSDAAKKRAAIACKKLLEIEKLPRAFKAGLRQLCAEHTISV